MTSEWDDYRVVQQGHIVISPEEASAREDAGEPKFSFADRAHGFKAELVRSGDLIAENKGYWAHMRPTQDERENFENDHTSLGWVRSEHLAESRAMEQWKEDKHDSRLEP